MARATEDMLARLHELTANQIVELINDPETKAAGVQMAIRFLRDNGITATVDGSEALRRLHETRPEIPNREELKELMRSIPTG